MVTRSFIENDLREDRLSRRRFLSGALAALTVAANFSERLTAFTVRDNINISSPDGNIQLHILAGDGSQLRYGVLFKGSLVIESSPMGIIVDSLSLAQGIELGRVDRHRINEGYPCRGVHSYAVNRCNGVKVSVSHKQSKTRYTVEARIFNDGIAFRYVVPGDSLQRVPDEVTAFLIPANSTVWYHDFEGHYEGIHVRKNVPEVQAGNWAAPPLTIKLPNEIGYAAITEAALINYSGMGLEADGASGFRARLGHAHPVSYPFRLRYSADQERLAKPAAITGAITTPWRVVMLGRDLNTLVNSDIVSNLSPPPDKKLFPQGIHTEWIKPGRAVWKYLDGGENTLEEMKSFSVLAGRLGFEYQVVEGFWQRWSEDQLRELTDFSKQHKVGIWLWKHSRDLRTPEARQKFFILCNSVGAVGAKIDFFDHEAKEIIDLYQSLLEEAARHRIMVNFHGANKPTGESRMWPNELTREGIRGMEYRSMQARAVHDTTLPFTRMLAGPADYTPMLFGERRRETSWAHQIASAAILTSPLLTYAAHPKNILENPAVEVIKSIPSVWDETIALPICEIGEIAAFARRTGTLWFLAIMNGPTERTVSVALSFLGRGKYQSRLVRDQSDDGAAVKMEDFEARRENSLTVRLRAGGGFIGRFSRI